MIPGANVLSMALQLIGRATFQYCAYASRTLQPNGQWLTTYKAPCTVTGSVQPVPRELFERYGLEFQNSYIHVFIERDVIDVTRDVSGDQIVFNGKTYQVLSKTDWKCIDGWDEFIAVLVI